MNHKYDSVQQASRYGKKAITIYVRPESKEAIRMCLIKNNYGWSLQEGIASLLQELLDNNGYEDVRT